MPNLRYKQFTFRVQNRSWTWPLNTSDCPNHRLINYFCVESTFVWMQNSWSHLNIKNIPILQIHIMLLKNILAVILDCIFLLICIFILIKHYIKTKLFLQPWTSLSQHLHYFVPKLFKTRNSSKIAFSHEKHFHTCFSRKKLGKKGPS